jgi:hypothetical protein
MRTLIGTLARTAAIIATLAGAIVAGQSPSTFDVRAFGANGDGKALDTDSIDHLVVPPRTQERRSSCEVSAISCCATAPASPTRNARASTGNRSRLRSSSVANRPTN